MRWWECLKNGWPSNPRKVSSKKLDHVEWHVGRLQHPQTRRLRVKICEMITSIKYDEENQLKVMTSNPYLYKYWLYLMMMIYKIHMIIINNKIYKVHMCIYIYIYIIHKYWLLKTSGYPFQYTESLVWCFQEGIHCLSQLVGGFNPSEKY